MMLHLRQDYSSPIDPEVDDIASLLRPNTRRKLIKTLKVKKHILFVCCSSSSSFHLFGFLEYHNNCNSCLKTILLGLINSYSTVKLPGVSFGASMLRRMGSIFSSSQSLALSQRRALAHISEDVMQRRGTGLIPENEHNANSRGESELPSESVPKVLSHCGDGSSRSPVGEKAVDSAVLAASVIHDGGSDSDLKAEDGGHTQIDKVENITPEDKSCYAHAVPDEDATYECKTEKTESQSNGMNVDPPLVFEIPYLPSHDSFCSDKMATFSVSNLIGIELKPFDPSTYIEEDFYVTDASGCKRRLPSTNIIRWRQVTGPDGKTSVETNARFVTWSDGSLQLFIGKESFDVSEQDAKNIQSHIFLKHEKGLYQAQGRISRKMKFRPSSLSSNSHNVLAAMVNSQNKNVCKVKQYITDVDPEIVMEERVKAGKQIMHVDKRLSGKKKKVASKYKTKGFKEKGLASGFLEDAIDQKHYEPQLSAALHHIELDQEKEAAAEKRLLSAKMGANDPLREKSELKSVLKGRVAEVSVSPVLIKEVQEEHEEILEDSDDNDMDSKARGVESRSSLRKKYVESDEESPPRGFATQRQLAIAYDSSDE